MTRSWVLTLLTTVLLAAPYAIRAQTTFHASGEFAETHPNANGNFFNFDIFVARGCAVNPCTTNNTILMFSGTISTANGNVFIDGSGVIPDSSFDASSPDHATLNVDTSQLSGFSSTECAFLPGTGFTCQPGPAGVIQIEWKRTRAGSNTLLSENDSTQGTLVTHSHLDQDFFTAAATGSFLGTSFSDQLGATIGANKNTVVTRSRQQ